MCSTNIGSSRESNSECVSFHGDSPEEQEQRGRKGLKMIVASKRSVRVYQDIAKHLIIMLSSGKNQNKYDEYH